MVAGRHDAIRSVLEKAGLGGEQIRAVGLTGQMHGLVLLDEIGEILRPAILWNDQRTQQQCDEIHARIGREKFIQITGNVALTGFTAPKILWVGKTSQMCLPGQGMCCCRRTISAGVSPASMPWTKPMAPVRCCST